MLLKLINKNVVVLDQAIYSGSSFVLTLVLSRILGLGLFGVFSTFVLALFLVSSISQAILVQPMQTKVAELKSQEEYPRFLFVAALFFVVLMLIGLLFTAIINEFLPFVSMKTLLAFGLYLCFFILHDFLRKYYLAKGEEKNTLFLDAGYSILLFTAMGAMWFFEITNLNSVFILLTFCFAPFVLYFMLRNINFTQPNHEANVYFNYHLKEGKWFLFASVSQWFSSNIFVLSSGVFLSVEALGALRLVQTVFGLLNSFLQSVENYIIPKVNLMVGKSMRTAQSYLNQLLKKSLWILLPILAFLFFFSSEVITFIGGSEYAPFHSAVKGFAILYLLIFLFYPIRILVRAMGLNKSFFVAYLVSLIFGIVSSSYLLQQFGLNGAIVGFISGQIILCMVWLMYLSKEKIQLWKLYI